MQDKKYLMIPGPTPVPPTVVAAMSQPLIGHRSDDFAKLHEQIVGKLKKVFQTNNDIFVLTNSGTGALETAIANTINPGDKVLALITGNFGERFANIAKAYGAQIDEVDFGWGNDVDLKVVEEKLAANSGYKVVLATQNETSTGVKNDIAGIAALVSKTPALLLVDGVSGIGAIEHKTDEWSVDILCTASQKALMLPPGLSMVTVSEKAWRVVNENQSPRFYFSLLAAKKVYDKWNTAYTPGVSMFLGLDAALDMMLAEGMDNVYARHALLAKATRAAAKALGLKLLSEDRCASNALTAIWSPEGIGADDIRKVLKKQYGIAFAGGQGKLKGKIFRIAHMGFADKMDIMIAVSALEMALAQVGYPVKLGSGVKAAQEVFLGKVE
ncbi:alanine--glyoxylate aminotransferase family protein [Pelotomaculum terephthalicicum JT]|uniref:pyridoxal-phosphate-dependent aminotransferase family protein n=1 Tax=Pelotomaculum TaxID=191373 RepID=UPI0009D2CF24|nr:MULTISPECIES: alanine--glyoxylate aminotransferase family protein [Pelotomaculum]MCG9969136.1 alanine--glyoxylate aminotransferase family protein [Pelotomaculum terephthalicicum JT]OPX90120.1 MAG: Soluble hydrogenase 42 kDa subunit [Pelotomaculum sp. PtaB.Bin117]